MSTISEHARRAAALIYKDPGRTKQEYAEEIQRACEDFAQERVAELEKQLAETKKVRDEWCHEYTKARDALATQNAEISGLKHQLDLVNANKSRKFRPILDTDYGRP